ncbi:Uncharacterised protein [Pragia fontium]|uniref:T6SS effector BTH_I2691 family protein n=1 Tax=Pragia fontium TaxID=82985 RepID=UPI000E012237|nr:T6SS effector BTH_I2691 family protein [Pragia fontium]SUB82362.1 Uncharacterised protein [Pragia fontium]
MTQKTNNAALPSVSSVSAQISSNSSIALNSGCKSSKHDAGGCPACQKEGDLFLLPLRYAVTCKEEGFPVLPLPSGAEGKFSPMPLNSSHYCTQMLREGYLYVLEERESLTRWRGFTVSAEGCLSEAKPECLPDTPPKFNCDVTTHGVNAACINFQHSDQINLISIVFSPDKITKSRLDYYQGEGKTELQSITPEQIKLSVNTSDENRLDVIKPEDLLAYVLEFYLADFSKKKYDRGGHIAKKFYNAQLLIEEVENISGKPVPKLDKESINKPYSDMLFSVPTIDMTTSRYPKLIEVLSQHNGAGIVINDAIGITQSLSDWRNKVYDEQFKDWFQEVDSEGYTNEEKYIIFQKLQDLKNSYREKRIATATKRSIEQANQSIDAMRDENYLFTEEMEKQYREKVIAFIQSDTQRVLSGAEKTAEFKAEFENKYWSQLNKQKLAEFESELNKRTEMANQYTVSRDKDVLLWLQSQRLIKHLDVYDQQDIKQGILFSEQVGRCFFGISSSPLLSEALDRWWTADFSDNSNLCWRAYLFNQKKAEKYLNNYIASASASASSSVDDDISVIALFRGASPHLDSLLTLFGQVDDMIERGYIRNHRVAMLAVIFADLGRAFLRGVATNRLDRLLVGRFTNMIIASIGQRAIQLNILEQLGQGVNQVNINLAERKGTYARGYVETNLRRALENPAIGNFYKVRLNGGLAILESVVLLNLVASFKAEGKDYLALTAGVTTLSATAFSVYASYIELAYAENSVMVRNSTCSYLGRFSFWGGTLNFIAGGALAISDFIDAKDAINNGNNILFIGYLTRAVALVAYTALRYTIAIEASAVWLEYVSQTSTVSGYRIASGYLYRYATSTLVRTSLPRMLVWVPYLGIIIIVATIGIFIFEPNQLESWFKRCCFGRRELKDKYADIEEEMRTLSLAVEECI